MNELHPSDPSRNHKPGSSNPVNRFEGGKSDAPTPQSPTAKRKFPWPILILVALFVIVPFLSWYGTWFGRSLSDEKMEQYLADKDKPRNVQHALSQIATQIIEGDQTVKRWYPSVQSAAGHESAEVRLTAAWVMGQDASHEPFHEALLAMLRDYDAGVRHNAALSLVRFNDPAARPELVAMLTPHKLEASDAGTVELIVDREGAAVRAGSPLVRIKKDDGGSAEIRAPEAGHLELIQVEEGSRVEAGAGLVVVAPTIEQVWEALRALYIIGQPEDLPYVERYMREVPGMPERVRKQAASTVQAIRSRGARGSG